MILSSLRLPLMDCRLSLAGAFFFFLVVAVGLAVFGAAAAVLDAAFFAGLLLAVFVDAFFLASFLFAGDSSVIRLHLCREWPTGAHSHAGPAVVAPELNISFL